MICLLLIISVLLIPEPVSFTPEENNRLSAISQRFDRVNDERGFTDCVAVILEEHRKQNESNTDADLMALSQSLKKNKGYGGT